jgi:hypothetical protein
LAIVSCTNGLLIVKKASPGSLGNTSTGTTRKSKMKKICLIPPRPIILTMLVNLAAKIAFLSLPVPILW